MILEDLMNQFILLKKRKPFNTNELLNYVQKSYICGELSLNEYKELFFSIKKQTMKRPNGYTIKYKPSSRIKAL